MVLVWHDYCFASEDLTGMSLNDASQKSEAELQLIATSPSLSPTLVRGWSWHQRGDGDRDPESETRRDKFS